MNTLYLQSKSHLDATLSIKGSGKKKAHGESRWAFLISD